VKTTRRSKYTISEHPLKLTVTTEPSDERNLLPGFIQLRTPARINICSATQQPLGTKLETIWHRRAIQTTRQSNAIQRGT